MTALLPAILSIGAGRWLCQVFGAKAPARARWAAWFLIGAPVGSLLMFALCALKLAQPWILGGACLAVGLSSIRAKPAVEASSGKLSRVFYAALFLFGAFYLLCALAPETSPDGTAYHLGVLRNYLHEGGLVRVDTNFYWNLPQGAEMLYLPAYAWEPSNGAAVTHLLFLLALAILLAESVGLWPALAVLTAPVFAKVAPSAYVDVVLAAAVVVCVWLAMRDQWALAGLLAGFALSVKYSAFPAPLWLAGYAMFQRKWRGLAVAVACGVLAGAPWLVKNWLWLSNPLAPFANEFFPNPHFDAVTMGVYSELFRWRPSELGIPNALKQMIIGGPTLQGFFGPWWFGVLLAPLAWRNKSSRPWLTAALLCALPWFGNTGARFLMPAFALASAAIPPARSRYWLAALFAVACWPGVVPLWCYPAGWRQPETPPWRAALRMENETAYLRREVPGYRLAEMLNRVIPPGEAMFTWGAAPEGYLDRVMRIDYHSTHNRRLAEVLLTPTTPALAPASVECWALPREKRSILEWNATVTATTRVAEVWLTNGDGKVTPAEGTVSVNPWEARDFLDGSAVTAWTPRLNGTQQARFAVRSLTPVETDGVCIASRGLTAINLGRPLRRDVWRPEEDLRRSALEVLRRDGVHWLVLFDGQLRDQDFLRMADNGLLRLAGREGGARLYRF
jgi:hypothetical protein